MKWNMPGFCCAAVISTFTTCGVFHMLQHMNKIYKIFVLKCLHKSDKIKLAYFSAKNLLVVTSVMLVYHKNIPYTVLWSIYCLNVVWRKRIFKFSFSTNSKVALTFWLLILLLMDTLFINSSPILNQFFLLQSLQCTLH